MKTRRFALCLATVFLVAIYINIQRSHTFTLSNDEGTIKTEQIQPLWGTLFPMVIVKFIAAVKVQ